MLGLGRVECGMRSLSCLGSHMARGGAGRAEGRIAQALPQAADRPCQLSCSSSDATRPTCLTLPAMQIMVRWLSRFFNYLDRYYIQVRTTACSDGSMQRWICNTCWDGKLSAAMHWLLPCVSGAARHAVVGCRRRRWR